MTPYETRLTSAQLELVGKYEQQIDDQLVGMRVEFEIEVYLDSPTVDVYVYKAVADRFIRAGWKKGIIRDHVTNCLGYRLSPQ